MNCTNVAPSLTVTPAPTYRFVAGTSAPSSPGAPIAPAVTNNPAEQSVNVNSSSSDTGLIVVVVCCIVVVGLIAGFVVYRLRKPKRELIDPNAFQLLEASSGKNGQGTATKGSTINESTIPSSEPSVGDIRADDLAMWKLDHRDITMVQRLAEGAFGEVWLATYLDEKVAVKTLHRKSSDSIQSFIAEIQLVAKMDSPHIVKFIGVSYKRLVDIQLVTEYMNRGDLRSALQQTIPSTYPWAEKISCAMAIADALVYLHTSEPKVIHRDLKSRNVLLDTHKEAKLTDFGISRENMDEETMTVGVGTYRWMAPEVLVDGHYTTSADIYSYGVIFSELDTHELPFSDQRNASGNPLTDSVIMTKVMSGELRPSFRPECPSWFKELAMSCMNHDPTNRPTAMEIAYTLRCEVRKAK
ncbi:kinase [Thraustotheca clavata]|uniref:Kinase n=1 Tax=Thraustotheca clavata TaxID=74557 RepID=A0A1V9ZUY6_9STRA|nr:kinase [Thraustotheca clavata]